MQFLSDIVKASGCTTLSMSNNPLGAETGQCLAQVLGGSKLESLHLVGCNLGSAGVSSMCLHAIELPTSCRLRLLDLSDNDIGEEGAFRLAESLQAGKWNSLTDLRLSKNHLGERGVSLIAEALPQTCIRSLDLSETNCDSDSFIKLLSGNSRLERLRLFKNELGSTGFTKISKLIGQCPLLELDLGGNQADSEAVEYLLEALLSVDTTHLLLLEIGGNATSMKVENIIRRVVQKHKNLDIARDSPKN
jgi:Ran GTPase-activating protein (RanGAP) involved in mRNA processing and transport